MARADGLDRFQVEAPGEDRQPGQDLLLERGQQVKGPVNGGSQRALPRLGGTWPTCKDPEALVQTSVQMEQRHRRQAGGGEFDGEREPVETPADRRRQAGRGIVQGKRGVMGATTLCEQPDRVGPVKVGERRSVGRWQRERTKPEDTLALDAEGLARGGQHARIAGSGG